MHRKHYFLAAFFVIACGFSQVGAQTAPFGLYEDAEFSPDFIPLESNSDMIRFTLDMARLQPDGQIDLNQRLPGTWGEMNATGALMPRFTFYLALPPTGNPTVTIENWETITRSAVPRSIPENTAQVPRVELGQVGILGGVRLLPVTVKPVTYTNGQNTCAVLDVATIRIDIDGQQGQNPLPTVRTAYSEAWRSVYQAVVMNWQDIPNLMVREPSHILMIVPDPFLSFIQEYIVWKQQLGFIVTVVSESEIDDDNVGTQLRNRITSELDQSSPKIDYVILVGDENTVPAHLQRTEDPMSRFSDFSYPGDFTNEGYFTEVVGTDPFPDVFLGRWVVNNQSEARSIALRTIQHEKNTFASDSTRFERCAVSADNSVPSQQITIAYAREMMLQKGFEQVDTVWASDNGTAQQLINLVDDGVTFVNHRGSGWNQGWAGINFYYWTVPEISNSGKLCIVTGIGCGVAKFDAPDAQCFGEQWMLHGSPTNPQGAVGFIGPCWNTHTVYNDNLDTCLYRAILTYNIDNLMPALVAGKMFTWALFADFQNEDGVNQVATVMMRQYLGLCDPSLKLFTDTPERLPVTLPSAIPAGPFSFPVTIADGFASDVDSISISFRTETGNQLSYAIPARPGMWYLPVDFAFDDSVVATIDGHNLLARQVGITVAPSGVYLIHQGTSFSDASGNNDGHIQPGETITLIDTVRNIGSDAAFEVVGSLSTSSDNVSITAQQSQYGDVGSNEMFVGSPQYSLTVSPDFRGSNMAMEIAYEAAGVESRSDLFFLTVYTPELETSDLSVADGDDGFIERLESAGLVFTITNTGNETLIPSALQLQTTSDFVVIEDGTAQIPAIAPGSSYTLPEDAVRVSGAWNAPTGTQVTVNALITAQMPTYAFSRSLALPLVLGQIGQADPMTGSDNTYYMYDDLDVAYDRVAVYDWFEISPTLDGPGTIIEFTQSQQTFAVPVPFSYGYFGESFNSLSVSTDGWVSPGNSQSTSYDNHVLPYSNDLVSGMIAVLWNDLWYFFGDTGDISYYYDSAGDRFIVEWHEVTDWGTGTRPNTFQVQLLNPATHPTPTGDAEWLMLYQDLTMHPTAALGATIGYETFDELYGATFYHNNVEPPTSAPLANGRAIRLTTAPPTITDTPEVVEVPKTFTLFQNYPNPFNPETTIEYALAARANVKLEVFDVLGRSVITLAEGKRDAGIHRLQWNGKSNSGVSVPSGIYFYRLVTPEIVQTRRMLLMR